MCDTELLNTLENRIHRTLKARRDALRAELIVIEDEINERVRQCSYCRNVGGLKDQADGWLPCPLCGGKE